MKKVLVNLVLVLVALSCNARESMKIVYSGKSPPLSWQDESGQMRGILVDVLQEALQNRMQVPLDHNAYPWVRAQMLVKKNKADAFVSVPTPERLSYIVKSQQPVVDINFTLFTRKDHPRLAEIKQIKSLEQLSGFRLGNYRGNGWAVKNLANMDVQWAPSRDNVLNMLTKDRVDILVSISRVTKKRIVQLGMDNELIEVPNVLQSNTFNLCINKDSYYAHLIKDFDKTIAEMQADGSLREIYSRYH